MTALRQAAEMALKEMQRCADDADWVYDDYFEVIKALRQALAEPEQTFDAENAQLKKDIEDMKQDLEQF